MPLLIFFLLQLADVWSTLACMRYGGAESNPIANWLFTKFGLLWGIIALKAYGMCAGLAIYTLKPVTLKYVNGFFLCVVVWNLLILSALSR